MSSPFEIFRRNLKPLMVLLTGLALFAFVVLPVVDSYMRRNSGAGGEIPAARFDGQTVSESRVAYFTRNHNATIRFLGDLARVTLSRGGIPNTAGFQYNPQTNQILSIGINESSSPEMTVRTLMYAAEADKAGFELDDASIALWLDQFTDGQVSNNELTAMLMQATQNQMGRPHLYEQLRSHLLAATFARGGQSGLFAGGNPMNGPLITPAEQWANFLKVNRTATADTYAVLVNDYLDQTDESPGEAEIDAVYEEGKDRLPDERSSEPAFRKPYTASFEYLVADYQKILDEEVSRLKEEDIRAEYERRLKGGDFQLPEVSASELLNMQQQADASAESADDATSDEEASTDGEATPSSEEPTAAGDSEGSTNASEPTTDEGQAPSASETEPSTDTTDDATADSPSSGDSEPSTDEPDAASDQSSRTFAPAARLVSAQEQDQDASDANASDSNASETAASDADEASPATAEPAADDSVPDSGPDSDGSETTDAQPVDDSGQPAADSAESAESEKDTSGSGDASAESQDSGAAEDAEPKVESFDDVRKEIAEDMAGPAARRRIEDAMTSLNQTMRSYFSKYAIYESSLSFDADAKEPVRPNLEELGKEVGFEYASLGPIDRASIATDDETLANSFEVGSQLGRGPNFSVVMYGLEGPQQREPRGLFIPLQTANDPVGKSYISWKTGQTDAYTPTLSEVRDEVVMSIRMSGARELARSAAEDIAERANQQEVASLTDLDGVNEENVKTGLGPFSWMESFGQFATIGNVPDLDTVGEDFMKTVFNGSVGQYQVAENESGRVVYVVKPNNFEPPLEELRRRFREPFNRRSASFLGADETGPVLNEFFDEVEKRAGFESFLPEQVQ